MAASICFFLVPGTVLCPTSALERSNTVLAAHYSDFINKDRNEPNFRTTALGPDLDVGVTQPTAAISSIPFTPNESMEALRYFYDVLGQGPIIVIIENYRKRRLWK